MRDSWKRVALLIAFASAHVSAACSTPSCPPGTKDVQGNCVSAGDQTAADGGDRDSATADAGPDNASGAGAGGESGTHAGAAGEAGSGAAGMPGSAGTSGSGAGAGGGGAGGTPPSSSCSGSEVCDNQDNDCDGQTDEKVTRACGPTPQGLCRPGTETCSTGTWSACEGAIQPAAEQCDTASVDENCNGTANEDCACTPGMMQPCGVSGGICVQGMQTCNASGQWGAECVGAVSPGTEVCDGVKDENCDGEVDEGCECTNGDTRECGVTRGVCVMGRNTCSAGRWSTTCAGEVRPSTEICDASDNDCDGQTDEDVLNACGGCRPLLNRPETSCTAGMNSCQRTGQYVCDGDDATRCNAVARAPGVESCNSSDDDCDGDIDEGLQNPCGGSCTTTLDGTPGELCAAQCTTGGGFEWGGHWECLGMNAVRCEPCEHRCAFEDGRETQTPNPCIQGQPGFLTCVPVDETCFPPSS